MTTSPAAAQHLRALALLRRVRDRIDREYAQPLDVEALARDAHGAATSLTGMDITIHASFLPHDDPEASLAFYRDALGFEVRGDVGYGGMRWITVGPPASPARPSSCTRRPPIPASPTTSAAPSPR